MKSRLCLFAALLCMAVPGAASAASFELRLVVQCIPRDKVLPFVMAGVPLNLCVDDTAFLTGADIAAATDITGKIPAAQRQFFPDYRAVEIAMTPTATDRATAIIRDHPDEEYAVLADGNVLAVISTNQPPDGSNIDLLVAMNDDAFAGLVKQLNTKTP